MDDTIELSLEVPPQDPLCLSFSVHVMQEPADVVTERLPYEVMQAEFPRLLTDGLITVFEGTDDSASH